MGKYFGTDGFRGEANCNLTADHAFKVGRFLGWYYCQLKRRAGIDTPARIVIGKDTRRSSYMFEYSLVGGLVGAILCSWLEPRMDDFRFTAVDVGQGQCLILQNEGKYYPLKRSSILPSLSNSTKASCFSAVPSVNG